MAVFGLAALFLSGLGVYGVVAFAVSQRTREIGLRSALGATRRVTLGHVLGHSLSLAGAGVAVGSLSSLALERGVGSMIAGVPAIDIAAVAVAGALLLAVTLAASAVPALRATRIDPTVALRDS